MYSDTLRKPWKAVSMAAQSMSLSLNGREEFHKLCPNCVSIVGVMGMRFGFLNLFP